MYEFIRFTAGKVKGSPHLLNRHYRFFHVITSNEYSSTMLVMLLYTSIVLVSTVEI